MLTKIENIIAQLSAPLTQEEAAAGWTEKSKKGVLPFFEELRGDVADGRPIAYIGIARSLDTWGVDGGGLYNEIIEIAAALNS